MNKQNIIKTAVCISVCLCTALVLAWGHYFSEKYKTKKIGEEVQRLLTDSGKSDFRIGASVFVKSPVQSSLRVFTLVDTAKKSRGFAYAVRITGICGPVPAVFMSDIQGNIEFIGIAGFNDTHFTQERVGISDAQLAYWAARLYELTENIEK